MGRRGTRPMPKEMAKARGYKQRKGRRPVGKEMEVKTPLPPAPKSVTINKDAKKCWDTLSKRLKKSKVVTGGDDIALEGLCRAYATAMELDRDIDREGIISVGFDGRRYANPAVAMSRQAWAEVRKWAVEFGLTPSARTRVTEVPLDKREEVEDSKDDPDTFFFGGRVVGSIGA